jgi:hypothetical protein
MYVLLHRQRKLTLSRLKSDVLQLRPGLQQVRHSVTVVYITFEEELTSFQKRVFTPDTHVRVIKRKGVKELGEPNRQTRTGWAGKWGKLRIRIQD